jgi:hypothetical protein
LRANGFLALFGRFDQAGNFGAPAVIFIIIEISITSHDFERKPNNPGTNNSSAI